MIAAAHPANLHRTAFDRLDAARKVRDRVEYANALTSIADLRIYEAAYQRIPEQYIDPSSGQWEVPDTACRACWQQIEGPVFALGAAGACLHYHPYCRPHYPDLPKPPLGQLYPAGRQHPRRSCLSQLAYYAA